MPAGKGSVVMADSERNFPLSSVLWAQNLLDHPIKSEKDAGESSNDVGTVLVEWVDNFSILRADATKSVHFTRIPATSIGDAHKQSVLVDGKKTIIENYL